MSRLGSLVAAVVAAVSLSRGAEPRWMISSSAIHHLERAGAPVGRFYENPGNFIMNGAKGAQGFPPGYRAVPAATFPSYAAMKQALYGGKLPKETRAVLYDCEAWQFTPPEEQHDIAKYARLAADLAHRHGLTFIATPATDLVRILSPNLKGSRYDEFLRLGIAAAAARYADIYEIQAQGSIDNLALYTRYVKAAAAQAREANPKVTVFGGISTNPSGKKVTGKNLFLAVAATRGDVAGYWLNIPGGGPWCPRCGEPQPSVAVDMLRMLDHHAAAASGPQAPPPPAGTRP